MIINNPQISVADTIKAYSCSLHRFSTGREGAALAQVGFPLDLSIGKRLAVHWLFELHISLAEKKSHGNT